MIQEAQKYLSDRHIVRREPLYSANRFARLVSDLPVSQVTAEHLEQYRQLCAESGLQPRTIESSVSDLIAVVHHATGQRLPAGHRLRLTSLDPHPVPASDIDAIWPHCCDWLRDWIALTWWTALRLSDGMTLQPRLAKLPEVVYWRASKTAKPHQYPVPEWLRQLWTSAPPPWKHSTDYYRKHLRDKLDDACDRASVERFTPKQLRQRSITEWTRSNATAGQLIHGCGIGVMSHYLDPLSVLEAAGPLVRVPACFGVSLDTCEQMTAVYRRLDQQGQLLVLHTAERMAR